MFNHEPIPPDLCHHINHLCQQSAINEEQTQEECTSIRERRQSNLNHADDDVVSEDETEPDAQGKTIQQEKTEYFLTLDVSGTVARDVRMQRSGEGTIKLNDKRQADAIHHQNILIAVWQLGYNDNKTWAE